MAKACWICGKENAECSFETERWFNEDELSEIISTIIKRAPSPPSGRRSFSACR